MEIKLTPFVLFFILLLVLVISIVFMKNVKYEGFIDFYSASSPIDASAVLVPVYSTNYPISKLYDNLYFDKRNSNLVALNGPFTGTASTDAKTLSSISILPRKNNSAYNSVVIYTNPSTAITNYNSVESNVSTITESYQLLNLYTGTPSPYAIFYFAWNKDTYLHVVDLSDNNNKHIVSYYINDASTITTYDFSVNRQTHTYPTIKTKTMIADTSDNLAFLLNTTIPVYDTVNTVYQLNKNIFYDNLRGYVICAAPPAASGGSTTITNIYDYAGVDIFNTATTATLAGVGGSAARIAGLIASVNQFASVSTFTSSVVTASNDTSNNILIMSNANKKIIALISKGSGNTPIKVANYFKFNGSVIDTSTTSDGSSSANTDDGSSANTIDTSSGNTGIPVDSSKVYSEYMKWYTYWNSVGQPGNKGFSDDYLLKTQIVPPVCPACNSVGGCANCNAGGSSYSSATPAVGAATPAAATGAAAAGAATPAAGAAPAAGATAAATPAAGAAAGAPAAGAATPPAAGAATATPAAGAATATPAANQITTVDRGGALASTADPNSLGGSLTLGQLSFIAGLQDVGHVVGDTANNAVNKVGEGIGAVGQGVGSAGSGIYNTVNAAGQGIYSAGAGVGGAIKDTGAGIGGAIKDTGSYLGGALNQVGSTAYEAGKYVGTGVGNRIGDDNYGGQSNNSNIHDAGYKDNYYDPSRQSYNNSYRGDSQDRGATTNAPGQYTGTAIDNYSYYGALQSKGGNFMPLTSDFSKFGR